MLPPVESSADCSHCRLGSEQKYEGLLSQVCGGSCSKHGCGQLFFIRATDDRTVDQRLGDQLVRAGFKEKTVIAIIHSRPNRFDLNAERLIELKHNGVTDNVILAMISQDEMPLGNSDGWDDDAFFKKGTGATRGNGTQATNQTAPISSDLANQEAVKAAAADSVIQFREIP